MDVNSRDPSQNIIPFRIKGVEAGRFDAAGNLGIGTTAPTTKLDVAGAVNIVGSLNIVNSNSSGNESGITIGGVALENKMNSAVVVNIDSQPAPATVLNRQKKQSIPLAASSSLSTSDIVAKMSGVSVGKTQTYGVGPAQMASYGNIVVAVGEGTNSIAYSLTNPPTAASWVGIPNSAATFSTRGRNIAYANGTWVAVGEGNNSIAYSTMTPPVASSWVGIPNNISFNAVTTTNTFGTRGNDIAYGNGAWVAVGSGTNSIAYSLANPPTAESWVGITTASAHFGTAGYGITFGNGTWVATGEGTNGIAYSTRTPPTSDSWVGVPLNNTNDATVGNVNSTNCLNIIYTNGVWLAAGTGTNTLCYSVENPPIAGSWMPISTGVLFGTVGRSVAYGNGMWVACGESGALLAYSTSRIPHSSSWVSMKGPTPSSNGEQINHVAFNAATNTWYFMGDIGTNCMFYSTATPPVTATWVGVPRSTSTFTTQSFGAVGITTNAFTSPINVAGLDNKVTFPANRMLAVGGGGVDVLARSTVTPSPAVGGTISYSDDDGATWAMVPGGATNAMFSSAVDIASNASFGVGGSRGANAVAWNGEKWVAAGNGRTHSLAFSDDGGMTWSGVTGKSIFSVEARDVAWNGQMWVAVGRGAAFSTAYSYDGVTWMGPIDASGTPINVFSLDIAGPSATTSDISGGGNHVIWTGKMWVATGTRTLIVGSSPAAYYTIAYSTDGKTWIGVPESGAASTGFDMYAHGVAWNGRNYIATGRGTVNTLVFSTEATSSWQGMGNSVFSVWGRGITWGARRWMATGRGTNTVAYSTNGRNWQGCGANVFKPLRRFMAMGDTPLYTGVSSGQPQRGVAFSYSDDGVTWDAPVVNQAVEFNLPLGGTSDTTRSVVFTNNTLLTNAITDISSQHTALMFSADGGASWARVPGTSDTEANGGTGMTVANGGCYSLATNPTRTRFLAGGGDSVNATRKVYFSNDGFNWRNSISSPNAPSQMGWIHASLWIGGIYNRWLIGGSDASNNANGRIMVSGDADAVAAWATTTPATYTSTVVSCFAANTDFSLILAGTASGNVIYRSVNGGAIWTTVDISGTPTGSVKSIAFSPSLGRWVAVGGGSGAANTIIYSTDATGTAWIAPPLQAKTAATAIFKNGSEATRVIWDAVGGRFLMGGWNGAASTASLTNVFGLDATLNNNPGYTMAYSADGMNWTPVTVQSSDASSGSSVSGPFLTRCRDIMALDTAGDFTPINTGYSVTWNSYANRFVATGNGTCPVVYSNDGGVTWTPANQQPPQQAIAVACGLSAAASTTSVSPITYTIDGKTWFQGLGAKEIFGTGAVNAVEYGQTSTAISPTNGRIWVAGGTHTSGTSCLAFSQNGIRWTAITGATTMMTNVRTIVYAPPEQLISTAGAANNAAITATSGVGNGVWVAGGDTTNSLIFSYDGISWSEVPNSLTILSGCNAIAFGNGLFVAGGVASSSGTTAVDTTANIFYSTDGINWRPARNTVSRISVGASIKSIAYGRDENGRGLWIAGASGLAVTVLYSYNGIDWAGVSNSGSTISSLGVSSIAYGLNTTTGRGLWVAGVNRSTTDGNAFVVSTTGRDGWTPVSNTKTGLFDVSGGGPTSISYFNGVWYATGSSAGMSTGRTLAYSYDGSGGWFGVYPTTNIYGTSLTTFSLTDMRCVATTNDYIVPSCASAGSAVSSGTAAASFRPAGMTTVRSIGWTAGVGSAYLQHPTIMVGGSGSGSSIAISADGGRTWGSSTSVARSAFRGGVCNDLFWNGSTWVAVGHDTVSGAKVATSKDGVSWSQLPSTSIPISGVLNTIVWNGSIWMVGGDGSPINDTNTASFAWSSDLARWNAIANTDISLTVVKRVAWNGMYWVAVGQGVATTIMYSKNRTGLIWEDTFTAASGGTTKTSAITTVVNDVVWGGGRWVAVGGGNLVADGSGVSILYSVDAEADYAVSGRRWVGVAASAHLFPYGANSVSWNGKRFIATGPAAASCSTGNIIAWSADGISWNAYSTAKTVAPGQRWVAVGSGSRACIATSADGRVWTDVAGTAAIFSDISGANATLVNTMKTGARAVGWNGSSLIVGGARSATTTTPASQATVTSTIGRTTIPVCAFIGSGNGVMGGGTTNTWDAGSHGAYTRVSSSVFMTHMDVNIREANAPWANMWLNTYTDLSATQLFQVTPEMHTFSSALKWNGWSWVANFGLTTFNPLTGEQYGSIWYCSDPLARVGWSVASNSVAPRILIGQGGYAALEWNGVAWLACGYDPNNNNLIYTTDKYGATGWTAVSGIVSGAGSASFQPVCIASSPRFWVVGGSQGTTSAMYFTSDRTGATGWRAIAATGGSVLPSIRISSVGYNGSAWICCGGGTDGTGSPASSISWRAHTDATGTADDLATGWATATISGTSGGIPRYLSNGSSIIYNAGAASPRWVVVGDASMNVAADQIAYTATVNGSTEWKVAAGTLSNAVYRRLTGIAWTGYSWIATSAAGSARILSTMDVTAATGWNTSPTQTIYSPTLNTNAVTFANIPISLLTTGMPSSTGAGAGTGAMWRAGAGRAQGLLTGGGTETTSVIVRSSNGAEGVSWSQVYSRNFLIAVGGGVIRDANNGGGTNRMAYSYDGGLSWTTNNTAVLTNAASSSIGTIRTVKYGNGIWVAGGDAVGSSVSGNNCLAWSRDGVNWTGAGGTQIFGSAGACYAVCCNDRGRWVAVGGSPLGTAGTYTNTSGSIYTMAWSDDGQNWTPVLGSRALFGIVCQGVSYGADASGVGMWTAIGRGSAYTGCAYSYDGKTWFLSQTSGSLFGTSANVLTERYAPVASANWVSVSISSTGQYQTAVVNGGQIYTSSDYGVNWTARDSNRDWRSVSISSTGQYQTAVVPNGQIYTSSDYGINWTPRDSSRDWRSVSISSTGQYQTAVVYGGQIYISSDYGINWTARDSGWTWISVSLSSTGQYQTAVNETGPENKIYTSSDYGINWTPRDSNRIWRSVSLSSTGQYQTAVVQSVGSTGYIYTSSDYGASWTNRQTDANRNWGSIYVSSTGQYQTAVVAGGQIFISSNFGETWSAAATDSRSLGITYGKDSNGAGMWVATAGRRDRDISANVANTMAYSYDGKLWRGIRASAGLSEQAWSVAYGKDGFGVGMWVAAGYDTHCGLKWSYDGVTWNATMGASGAAVWTGMAAGRRALAVYWNGSMWLASTSDTRNGEPRGTSIAVNNASSVPGYLLYSYNGKNWLPVLAPNTYDATISATAQPSIYSVLPNPAILDFGSFYDDQAQRGVTIANTTARTVGAVISGGVPVENINTIVPYGRGSLTTGQVPFLLGGDSGLVDTAAGVVSIAGVGAPPVTSDLAAATTSLSTSTDGGITWRAVPNSTRVMTKVNKILCDETTQQIVAVGTGNYSVATSTPSKAADADGWVGVFGSRMTDTRAGLFEKYGTGASWFGGAKMWIASGRAQTRRGSSLAVSVNGTVWQDAKIVSQVAAGSAGARGGGLTSRTTTGGVTPSFNSSVIPYTAPATPLLTYTDSAAAFSTQVSSVAVNSQYNRAVVGGSGVQFVAGGHGGIAVSNDGQNWTAAAAAGTATVFQSPTNTTTRTGSGGFDASFGTVALTQRLTTPTTYLSTTWRSVSLSSTGQYQTAVVTNGRIYTSSDYGINWTPRDSSNRNWFSVSISSTGQYQTAVVYSGGIDKIFTSSDYGINWTPRDSNRNWVSVSISSTGQYQTAVVNGGRIYTSSDYGINWTPRDSNRGWYSVSISSTGQYQTAVVNGDKIYTSSDYGVSWTPRDSNRAWELVSISSTGQYQTAVVYGGQIYISSDYGINWTLRDSNRNWKSVSLSSTGQYQTAVVDDFQIYTSSDYGAKWTPRDSNRVWRSVSISSTGQYQTAVVQNGHIYTSTDFGVTWVQRSTATRTNAFTRIKSSASGQYQLATSGPVGDNNGQLYVSSDYGQTWMPRRGLASWLGGAVSATGGVMMAMTPAPPTIIKLNNALSYSPILYLDATNPSSYNVSTNTWTNLGSLGGNVLMTNMGSFDVTDNGGSFNFNGTSNYGTLSIASTTLTSITYVAVVKPSTSGALIISFGDFNPAFFLAGGINAISFTSNPAYNMNATTNGTISAFNVWYHLAVTVTSTGSATFYINGVSSGTATRTAATWTQTSFGIGAATNGQDKFTGKISSVAAYNRVLTASEIYNLYFSSALIRSTDYGTTFTDIPGTTLTFPSYWRAIAATNSAAIQTALAHGSTIYRSSDYGSTWNSSAVVDVVGILTTEFSSVASPTLAWKSIAMSSDAKIQTGVLGGTSITGQIYVNSDYGRGAWTGVDSGRNWASVAMSADGRYQSAVVTSGTIYYNSTFGTGTWTAVSSPAPGFSWTGIAVSSADGKYQTAVASGATNIYVNSNFGAGAWASKEGTRNWFGVAMSSTGRYQTAINRGGFIYIDVSFGEAASWTSVLTDTPRDWVSVAMSSTGQYQTAVVAGGKIYVNNNYGANGAWVETEENRTWISVAISGATGRYQTAVAQNGQIYTNTNFGLGAWFAADSSRNWVSVTVSSDGKYQSAVVATSGQVYFSRDFGATWSTTAGLDIMGNRWQDVAVSAETGAVQVTCVSGGYLYVSSDTGANWVSTPVSINGVVPQATNRAWQAVAVSADGQYGLACVNNGYLYRSVNSGATWVSSDINIDNNGIQASPRWWQDVGISANGKYQVACSLNSGNIYYSKNYGASWTSLTAAGSRAWSSVALSENGSTISATTNDASGGVWVYSMPDDQFYRAPALTNSGTTTTPATVRAIAYGNSGVGAAVDGYWVAGADASNNTLAYSSNGIDWTAVVGSKTTLFNAVNGVAYGADAQGTPMWVAVGEPFVGSVPGATTYSIAYSYNMTTWTGVRNAANFTGQGNHVAYGQDEFGAGIWVAVGQGDGALAANLGDSAFGASNGTTGTTVFYSYDGANWVAATGTGIFAVSGTDVTWGVDASGVGMWVATGIGYTDPTTGAVIAGGQVAHSTNGRVWTPIRTSAPITPAMSPVTLTTRGGVIPPPPASSGFIAPVYGAGWPLLGPTIPGVDVNEYSGYSVSLSADGMTVAIGAYGNSSNKGITRVYKYNATTDKWPLLGPTIPGVDAGEQSGFSVSLSADGMTVAIGARGNSSNKGITRIYKYNATTETWSLFGTMIPGVDAGEQSGYSVSLSADGTTVAVGAPNNSSFKGITRIHKYNATTETWPLFGPTIPGVDASESSGGSVSLSADGTTVAVGAPNNSSTKGITRVYKYNATTDKWPLLGPMIPGVDAGEQSGISVSLSADGMTVAIGANTNSSSKGITRIYKYNATTDTWPLLGPTIPGVDASESSGGSVSLSADGTTVAIGARLNSSNKGITRIYKYNATTDTWPLFGPTIPGVDADEYSGISVSLSADGTTVAIGANGNSSNKGITRIYRIPVYATPTYSISNPAIADIYANTVLIIKDDVSGTATITATQPATPPFTAAPVTVQGTLTVSGMTYTLVYNTIYPIFTPFPGAVAGDSPCVAYGRAGSQGTGAPLWTVGGAGGTNVFAMSSSPTTFGTWSVVASNAPSAPFPSCNSIAYSNGVWVAGNNTGATNLLARSTDGGSTWIPVTASSISGILTGAAAVGANAFCNYSLAVADFFNDTNLRSWVAVQGTKNFMFDGGVSAVATPTPNIIASAYNGTGGAWWVGGGKNQNIASIAYTTDPSGAAGWTLGTSTTNNGGNGIADLEQINAIAFSPHTQNWLAVGVGSAATSTRTALYSSNGIAWTSTVVSAADASLNLNTCAWNQLDASASAAGRWIAGGTRSGVDASAVSLYISADVSGHTWIPIIGTGAILSQVYSLAFNGSVWIAAGTPATSNGSTSTLMRTTTDPTGAAGWQGIPLTNISTGGFDTAARSVTWNAEQQMWIVTGENTGSTADASFSSVIYSHDVNGAPGTWRSVRESNSICFSGEGTSIAFKGDKWFAAGQGTNQIVATTASSSAAANGGTATWTPITHGTALTSISDIAYTGRRLIATGSSSGGASNGVIYTTDNSGSVWTAAAATPGPGFNDALGGGTSVTFEPSIEGGAGHVVATGRSATNAISMSTDGGVSWNVSAAPSVQFSTLDASFAATTQPLFTTGGNSVAYVGNDTLFAGGANDVQWTGKRWVATGRNTATPATATATSFPDIINNNTSAVATSDDGMTWQCVSASQAQPNFTEGTLIASNSRIGPTPLINSQIVISDGGDTEPTADYGGMRCGIGGSGTGVAQIDIIAELPPVSNAASSGAVNILGTAGNGGANGGIGNTPTASFDTAAFSIITRPI